MYSDEKDHFVHSIILFGILISQILNYGTNMPRILLAFLFNQLYVSLYTIAFYICPIKVFRRDNNFIHVFWFIIMNITYFVLFLFFKRCMKEMILLLTFIKNFLNYK